MGKFFVESITEEVSKRGTTYWKLTVNDGTTKTTAQCFSTPSNIKAQDLNRKVVDGITLEKKGEFYNIFFFHPKISELEKEPSNSPLKSIKTKSDVSVDDFINQVKSFVAHLGVSQKTKEFLKFIDWKSYIKTYETTPAALKVHHAIPGGMLEHMSQMLSAYEGLLSCDYIRSFIKIDYPFLGILFHDYGKQFEYNTKEWKYAPEFALMGHHYMSAHYLQNLLEKYNSQAQEEFKYSTLEIEHIVHCILSHHANPEWGAVVRPATYEAFILHTVDMISGQYDQFKAAKDNEFFQYLGVYVQRTDKID